MSAPYSNCSRFNAHIDKMDLHPERDWTRFPSHHRLNADREEIVGLEGGLSVYAILLLPFHGDVTLITTFASRREFLRAMDLPDELEAWSEAKRYERAVFEMITPDDVKQVIEDVWFSFPDRYEQTATLLTKWVVEETAPERLAHRDVQKRSGG
jgi:hypothetical protein